MLDALIFVWWNCCHELNMFRYSMKFRCSSVGIRGCNVCQDIIPIRLPLMVTPNRIAPSISIMDILHYRIRKSNKTTFLRPTFSSYADSIGTWHVLAVVHLRQSVLKLGTNLMIIKYNYINNNFHKHTHIFSHDGQTQMDLVKLGVLSCEAQNMIRPTITV